MCADSERLQNMYGDFFQSAVNKSEVPNPEILVVLKVGRKLMSFLAEPLLKKLVTCEQPAARIAANLHTPWLAS